MSVRATDWIVCLGENRAVDAGIVLCPLTIEPRTPVAVCRDCRFLIWQREERRDWQCSTGPLTTSASRSSLNR